MNATYSISQQDYFKFFDALNNIEIFLDKGIKGIEITEERKFTPSHKGRFFYIWEFVKSFFNRQVVKNNREQTNLKLQILIKNITSINEVTHKLQNINFTDRNFQHITHENYYTLRAARLYNRLGHNIAAWQVIHKLYPKLTKHSHNSLAGRIKSFFDTGYRLHISDTNANLLKIHLEKFDKINMPVVDKSNDPELAEFYKALENQRKYRWEYSLEDTFKSFYKMQIYGGLTFTGVDTDSFSDFLSKLLTIGLKVDKANEDVLDKMVKKCIESPAGMVEVEDYLEELNLVSIYNQDNEQGRVLIEAHKSYLESYLESTFRTRECCNLLDLAVKKNATPDELLTFATTINHYFFSDSRAKVLREGVHWVSRELYFYTFFNNMLKIIKKTPDKSVDDIIKILDKSIAFIPMDTRKRMNPHFKITLSELAIANELWRDSLNNYLNTITQVPEGNEQQETQKQGE